MHYFQGSREHRPPPPTGGPLPYAYDITVILFYKWFGVLGTIKAYNYYD